MGPFHNLFPVLHSFIRESKKFLPNPSWTPVLFPSNKKVPRKLVTYTQQDLLPFANLFPSSFSRFELFPLEEEKAPLKIPSKRRHDQTHPQSGAHPKEYLYGRLDPAEFVQKLTGAGISGAKVDDKSLPGAIIIELVTIRRQWLLLLCSAFRPI